MDDLVLGNLGLNSYIKATAEEPARLYVHDFGQNGVLKQILTTFKNGVSYPIAGRDEIVRPMPSLRSRFPSYAAYGASRIEDIFPSADLAKARVLEARMLGSAVAIARAASAKVCAFSVVSAWSGVFDTLRFTETRFASGQSNAIRSGYGAVRLKKV